MRAGGCHAIGCRAQILSTEVFCARHLVMVESDVRRLLGQTFRPRQTQQSASFQHHLATARREILYHQTNGHLVPKDRPFEWDDEEGVHDGHE